MALVDDIDEFLNRNGIIGGSTGWDSFIDFLPESPDKCIIITETPGSPPESRFNLDYVSFQIRGRSDHTGYEDLRSKMQEIYLALHNAEIDDLTVSPSGIYVMCTAAQSGPLTLGQDKNRRSGLTWNFNVIKHR